MDMNDKKDMMEQVKYIQELKRMREELEDEIASVEECIKSNFIKENTEVIVVGPYKVTYKPVISTRVDTRLLKENNPQVYAEYSKTSTYRSLRVY